MQPLDILPLGLTGLVGVLSRVLSKLRSEAFVEACKGLRVERKNLNQGRSSLPSGLKCEYASEFDSGAKLLLGWSRIDAVQDEIKLAARKCAQLGTSAGQTEAPTHGWMCLSDVYRGDFDDYTGLFLELKELTSEMQELGLHVLRHSSETAQLSWGPFERTMRANVLNRLEVCLIFRDESFLLVSHSLEQPVDCYETSLPETSQSMFRECWAGPLTPESFGGINCPRRIRHSVAKLVKETQPALSQLMFDELLSFRIANIVQHPKIARSHLIIIVEGRLRQKLDRFMPKDSPLEWLTIDDLEGNRSKGRTSYILDLALNSLDRGAK